MSVIAGIPSPEWFTNNDNSESVRIVATLQPSGEWWAVDPYDGLWAVSEKTPESTMRRMEQLVRWFAKDGDKRLPDCLVMVFVDKDAPLPDRIRHHDALHLTWPNDHSWPPSEGALAH